MGDYRKKDITDLITKAAVVPERLKKLEEMMKYKDKELYTGKKSKRKKGR